MAAERCLLFLIYTTVHRAASLWLHSDRDSDDGGPHACWIADHGMASHLTPTNGTTLPYYSTALASMDGGWLDPHACRSTEYGMAFHPMPANGTALHRTAPRWLQWMVDPHGC
ncbi:unnamed protein product [Closterium sp. NIES-54]